MRVTMKRNIERFSSKQMYPYLSLVERKVASGTKIAILVHFEGL